MPAAETVKAVDVVERSGHAVHPDHGDERLPVLAQRDEVEEWNAEEQHDDAEKDERRAGQHGARGLRRRRHLSQVVEKPHAEYQRRAEHDAERFRGSAEHLVELVEPRRRHHRDKEPEEQRRAADRRCWLGMQPPLVGLDHRAEANRQSPNDEGQHER